MPNVNLVESKPLYYLESLETLNLTDNKIADIQEHIAPLLMTMHYLTNLQLLRNPVTKVFKYRDQIVLMTRALTELDGKTIKPQER
jgi:Leucine-rich repeat (LRR) protein